MSDQNKSAIVVNAVATWTSIAGRNETAPCLEIAFRRRTEQANQEAFIEEICLELPREWKPGTVFIGHDARKLGELRAGSTILTDSATKSWEVSQRITRDTWTLILCNTKLDAALPNDFGLDMAILLDNVGAESKGTVVVTIDAAQENLSMTIPPESSPIGWIVHLESDPVETNALARGQELVLRWNVQNVEGDAELRGSLPGANTMRIANGSSGQRTVRALGESVYSLTAMVSQEGKLVEVVRRVHVNIEAPQYGLNLQFVPTAVFPGGPVVCYRSAYNVKRIQFTRSADEPSLTANNYEGKETTIEDTFIVPNGPNEGRSWTIGAVYTSREGERSIRANQVTGISASKVETSMFLNLPVSFGTSDATAVHGMAAGSFIVTSAGSYSQIAKREWIAIATTSGLELWARDSSVGEVKVAADVQARKWKNNWLDDALAGEFLGVGGANDVKDPSIQCIVAVRKKSGHEGIAEVIEIDLPLREDNADRQVLAISDARFARGAVKVVPVGNRVYLLGEGAAISYERNLHIMTYRDEPQLALVAFAGWDVVGLTSESTPHAIGHLFALEKKSGVLLRFDVQAGIVMAPRMAAGSNDKVARLDELQRAQGCLSPTPPVFPREALEDGRGYTGKDTDGSILEYLNPIDEGSAMVALGGILLVRSEVVDPSIGQIIQDRAYDPRLDVWARCGHPFGNANRSSMNFFATTNSTLYCLANDELRYVEGSLAAYVGFMATDYKPIDRQSLTDVPWPETFTFPAVENKTGLSVLWIGGRLCADLWERGQWQLALVANGQTIITVDARVCQTTGDIEDVKAIVEGTGRAVPVCQWNAHTLTIAPATSQLQIHMQAGLVLPFSYCIDDGLSQLIRGESSTGTTLDIPSITGQTRCTLEFKYLAGEAKRSSLDARAKLLIVNGIVAEFQWEGKHSSLFDVDIEDGHTVRLTLDNGARR